MVQKDLLRFPVNTEVLSCCSGAVTVVIDSKACLLDQLWLQDYRLGSDQTCH